jgi:subtilisin family serine protease
LPSVSQTSSTSPTREIKVLGEWDSVFNGIALNISAEEAEKLKKIPGVKAVHPNMRVKALLQDSVPLIGADQVWQMNKDKGECIKSGKECLTGKGVTIAIIDTGVDYTHPDLGGCTKEDFLAGKCEKVIGGWDFTTCVRFNEFTGECISYKEEDNDPVDDNGHGTHVAGTAAGKGDYNNNNIYEPEKGEVWGVAPDAKIIAYKVLNYQGYGLLSDIINAIRNASDLDQDGDYSDHVDIISMSLGGPGNPDDAISKAVDEVVDAGVVAIIAAGNSGPSEETIGSPGTARKAITVGASYNSNEESAISTLVVVDKNSGEKSIKESIPLSGSATEVEVIADIVEAGYGTVEDFRKIKKEKINGKIALIKRGLSDKGTPMTFQEKVNNALANGVSGVMIYNDHDGLFKGKLEKKYTIPVVSLSGKDGEFLVKSLQEGLALSATLKLHSEPDRIAKFSSRGPVFWNDEQGNEKYIIKPDVVAPGVKICAAGRFILDEYGIDHFDETKCLDEKHLAISGTSMATPHVSGAVALIKQAHPDWTPEEIKMALRSTAKDLGENIFVQGYGRINTLKAISLTNPLVAKINSINGPQEGVFIITGDAFGSDFDNFMLFLGRGHNPKSWINFYSAFIPVKNGILYLGYIPNLLRDDKYSVKIIVQSRRGDYYEDIIPLVIDNVKISYPSDKEIIGKNLINIIGSINIYNVINYSIEYTKEGNPEQVKWNSDNIKLIKNSINVPNSMLALWNTSNLSSGFYKLRLIINTETFTDTIYIHNIYLDSNIKEGWPIQISNAKYWNGNRQDVLVIDLDNDAIKEIVTIDSSDYISARPSILKVYRSNGSLWWSKQLNASPLPETPIVAGDIDGDNHIEVFADSIYSKYLPHKVYGFTYDGKIKTGFSPIKGIKGGFFSTKIIADLDKDGINELIIRSSLDSDYLYIINSSGGIESESPLPHCYSINVLNHLASAAIGNFDGDRGVELIVNYNCTSIAAYDYDDRVLSNKWVKDIGVEVVSSPPVIGDLNGDGRQEIIILAINNSLSGLYVLNREGELMPNWPLTLGDASLRVSQTPVLSDLNNDSKLEIIIFYRPLQYVILHNRKIASGWPKFIPITKNNVIENVIADINGDDKADVILSNGGIQYNDDGSVEISNSGGIFAWEFNGTQIDLNQDPMTFAILMKLSSYYDIVNNVLWTRTKAPPTITDIDNDDKIDIIGSSASDVWCRTIDGSTCVDGRNQSSTIYVWDTDNLFNNNTLYWPMYRHDPQRTACYDCDKLTGIGPPPSKPLGRVQSKLVNLGSREVSGRLNITVQLYLSWWKGGTWVTINELILNYPITVKANGGIVKLDTIFNPRGISVSQRGKYRVYASFVSSRGTKVESNWEFRVV